MKPVTVWERKDHRHPKTRVVTYEWRHNHIEADHVDGDVPIGRFDEQNVSWVDGVWGKRYAHLDDENKVLD